MSRGKREFVRETERNIPVYKKVDVLVAGSGSAGLGATVAAARNGADVLLVERHSFLGGMSTASMQVWFGGPTEIMSGIPKEVAQRLDALGAARYIERGRFQPAASGISPLTYHISFDPETWKYLASDMVRQAGAKVLTNTWAVDAIVENQVVKGIIIENKSGRQAILADVVIDASGDADIAARAGAPMDKLPKTGNLMAMVMLFRIGGVNYQRIAQYARENPDDFFPGSGVPPGDFDGVNQASIEGIGGWISQVRAAREKGILPPDWRSGWGREGFSICGVSPYAIKNGLAYFDLIHLWKRFPWNAEDVCESEYEGRERIRTFVNFLKTVPGFEQSFLIDTATSIGIQDSRRIIGDYVFSREDLRQGRTFDDTISLHTLTWPDVPVTEDEGWIMHPSDSSQGDDKYKKKVKDVPFFQVIFGIPYRCLIPQKIDRLLVAGQTISMTYMAHEPGPCRGMVACMAWGQAAGTAAAIAAKQGISPRQVDILTLRKTLESQGVVLDKSTIDLTEARKMAELRGAKITHVA